MKKFVGGPFDFPCTSKIKGGIVVGHKNGDTLDEPVIFA